MSKGGKAVLVFATCLSIFAGSALAQGELRFCLRSEPKTFDPLKVEDDASVAIRYLTGGVLLRMNRQTQALEPELAQSWKVSKDGRQITFKLRGGLSFSDGTPFSAEDVAYTIQQLMDPSLHSPPGMLSVQGPETQRRRSSLQLRFRSLSQRRSRAWIGNLIKLRSYPPIPQRKKWRCLDPSCSTITSLAPQCC